MDDLYDILPNHYGEVSKKQGDILEYLSISIVKNSDKTITIWQPAYIDKMLQLAGINAGKEVRTPTATSYLESKNDLIKVHKTSITSRLTKLSSNSNKT